MQWAKTPSVSRWPQTQRVGEPTPRKPSAMAALKITKRRLSASAVTTISHSGAPMAISGRVPSWAVPANTITFMPIACSGVRPVLIMAMPVTMAQGIRPTERGRKPRKPSRAPARNGEAAMI
jgi:hypothetical protein